MPAISKEFMYAVVKTGGKQYRVEPGSVVDVELVGSSSSADESAAVGDEITFSEVLLVESEGKVKVGRPTVPGASVKAKVTARKRGPKVLIFKKLRRHGQQLKKGHRQELITVRVESIVGA